MSNILFSGGKQFEKISITTFSILFLLTLTQWNFVRADGSSRSIPLLDRQMLEDVVDDSPLNRTGDRPAWDAVFDMLKSTPQGTLEKASPDVVGFLELDRQPVEYRGRLVRISGRLLRCGFIPEAPEPKTFDEALPDDASEPDVRPKRHGFFMSWILVSDKKDVPICVCSSEVPEGFPESDTLDEAVTVTGIFYKRGLFLSADDEMFTTPTILAKTLTWSSTASKTAEKKRNAPSGMLKRQFWGFLALLIVLWIAFRFLGKTAFSRGRSRDRIRIGGSGSTTGKDEKPFDGKIVIPGFTDRAESASGDHPTVSLTGEKTEILPLENPSASKNDDKEKNGDAPKIDVIPIVLALLFGFLFANPVLYGKEKPEAEPIDAEFTKTLLQMDDIAWETLGSETIPIEQQQDSVLEMMNRLQRYVPYSLLKDGVSASFPASGGATPISLSALVADPAQFRGKAFLLRGNVVRVEDVALNPAEKKLLGIPAIYRCRFQVPDQGEAEIITHFAPTSWKRNEPIRERADVVGIYIKRIRPEKEGGEKENAKPVDGDAAIFDDAPDLIPLLVSPKIQWFPDTLLGNLGVDVGSFEHVPPLKIADLKKKTFDSLSPVLELLPRNEIIQRAFKFTEADRDPFYGMLRAAADTPSGLIEREGRKEAEKTGQRFASAVELFNNPAETRGIPVLLTGTAKRVLPTLVEDKEIKKLYGIDRYYQIYLFTDDSQGNPLVVCVASIPEGMPTGAGPDYNEKISVGAFPYKLWVYETSAKLEDGDGYRPSYAPLLVGRAPIWHPKKSEKAEPKSPFSPETQSAITFGIFAFLAVVWIFMRRLKTGKSIEFKLKK